LGRAAAVTSGLTLIVLSGFLVGCGDPSPSPTTTVDTSPPDSLSMDAFIPNATGNTVVTVTPTSGDKSAAIAAFPPITLIAGSNDADSGIAELRIDGETTTICKSRGDLAQMTHGTWLKKAPISGGPVFNPLAKLDLVLADLIRSCAGDFPIFDSLTGEFKATTRNGADLGAATATFSFHKP
jgi:hypothetical protein